MRGKKIAILKKLSSGVISTQEAARQLLELRPSKFVVAFDNGSRIEAEGRQFSFSLFRAWLKEQKNSFNVNLVIWREIKTYE